MLLFAVKSTLAAGLAWQIVSTLFGVEAAALAVVSAVIVVQVTSWQTVRKSVADAIAKLAAALTVQLNAAESSAVYTSMRELEDYVHTTEQTYSLGMDSTRLNP